MDVRARTLRPCAPQINRKFLLISSRSGYHTKRPEMLNRRGFQPVWRSRVSVPLQRLDASGIHHSLRHSVNVAAVTPFLDQILDRLVAEQFAQHRIDATGHALQAAADVDRRTIGQPGVQTFPLLTQ